MYNLAKGLGTQRADQSDSRFPTKRMPMGLIECFANDDVQKVYPMHLSSVQNFITYEYSDFMST